MTMRLITPGQDRASAAIANQSAVDGLTASGYDPAGGDFAGFGKKDPTDQMRFATGPFYDATHPTYGALNDDTHDDGPNLEATATAVGSSGVMQLLPGNGYRVKTNTTFTVGTLRALPGAKIRPQAGVHVTVNADHMDAGASLVFDNSLGGTFSVNVKGLNIRPQWFGWMGLGALSASTDAAGCANAIASVPDSTTFRLGHFFNSYFRSTVVVSLRLNLGFIAEHKTDAEGTGGAAQFTWDGPAGGRCMVFDRCQFPRFTGVYFRHLTNDTTFAGVAGRMALGDTHLFDDALTGNFGFVSPGQLVQVNGAGGAAASGDPLMASVAQRVSDHELILSAPASTAVSLAEWCIGSQHGLPAKTMLDFDGESGSGVLNGREMYTIAASSNRVTLNDGNVFPDMFDGVRQITLNGAGPGGSNLVTTLPVGGYINDRTFTVATNASTPVSNGDFFIVAPSATVGGLSTAGRFFECHWISPVGGTTRGLESVRIGRLSQTNNEFFTFDKCFFTNQGWKQGGAFASVSGTTLTFASDYFTAQRSLGMRVDIGNAGAGGTTVHSTHIIAITDTRTATLAAAAPTAQASAWTIVGEAIGRGVYIGMNNNSLDHVFRECDFNGLEDGVTSGGSYKAYECNSSFCENRFHIRQGSRACLHVNDIGEADGCILKMDGGGTPVVLITGDYDPQGVRPNGGLFDFAAAGNATITFLGGNIESTPKASATVFKLGPNQVKLEGMTFTGGGCSYNQLGLGTITSATSFDSDNHLGLYVDDLHTILAPARLVIGRSQSFSEYPTGGDAHVITSLLMLTGGYNGDVTTQEPTAQRAELDNSDNVGYNGGVLSAHTSVLFPTGGHSIFGSSDIAGYRVAFGKRGVGMVAGLDGHRVEGLLVESPKYTGGTLGDLYGARVQDLRALLAGGSITHSHGFYAEGAQDDNWFNGPTKFGSKTTVKAVAAIVAGGGTDTFDASTLRVRRITANGNINVASPTNTPSDGDQLTLDIHNNTAGVITVGLGPAFGFTFAPPAAGKRRTQRCVYDSAAALYVPDGAQSGDF